MPPGYYRNFLKQGLSQDFSGSALWKEMAFYLGLVAALWGCTNPLIKKGLSGVQCVKSSNRVYQFFREIFYLVTNWRYMVPFLLNQSGSVLYFFTLQEADLSVAVPITNSLTFVFTAVSGTLLGERTPNIGTLIGMFLVLSGITLCVLDKTSYTLSR